MNIDINNRIETTGDQVEINDAEDDENDLCDEEVSEETSSFFHVGNIHLTLQTVH